MFCGWHTRVIGFCITAVFAAVVAACSTYPLPQDVGRVPTVDIVKSIRCEARAGIEAAVAGLTDDQLAKIVPIVKATVVGYDFNFNMHESGSIGPGTPPLLTFTQPDRFTGHVNAGAILDRSNVRTFTIIEPLVELTRPENVEVCKDRNKGPNWAYPVAGTIGLDEIVRTYLRLELLTELHNVTKGPGLATFGSHVVFSDQLLFTTTLDADVSGTLALDAVVGRIRLNNVSAAAGGTRQDTHTMIVALTREPQDSGGAGGRGSRGGNGDDGDNGSGGGGSKGAGGSKGGSKGAGGSKGSDGSKGASGSKGGAGSKGAGGSKGGAGANGSKSAAAPRKETAAEERDRLISEGSVRDPRSQARLFQMNASAADSVAVELQQRRARNDQDSEAARALGQRFLDLLRVP